MRLNSKAVDYNEMTQEHREGQQRPLDSKKTTQNGLDAPEQLVFLKTMLETTARDNLLDVYVTSVPPKKASGALR